MDAINLTLRQMVEDGDLVKFEIGYQAFYANSILQIHVTDRRNK